MDFRKTSGPSGVNRTINGLHISTQSATTSNFANGHASNINIRHSPVNQSRNEQVLNTIRDDLNKNKLVHNNNSKPIVERRVINETRIQYNGATVMQPGQYSYLQHTPTDGANLSMPSDKISRIRTEILQSSPATNGSPQSNLQTRQVFDTPRQQTIIQQKPTQNMTNTVPLQTILTQNQYRAPPPPTPRSSSTSTVINVGLSPHSTGAHSPMYAPIEQKHLVSANQMHHQLSTLQDKVKELKLKEQQLQQQQPRHRQQQQHISTTPQRSGRHIVAVGGDDDSEDSQRDRQSPQHIDQLIYRVQTVLSKPDYDIITPSTSSYKRASTASSSSEIVGEENRDDGVVRCVSPLPISTTFEPPIHQCAPGAFRFYMEQHIENIMKQYKERQDRRRLLERDMASVNFNDHVQQQMRRILAVKESKYLRSSRQRLDESTFEKIKTIGVGAFGKVVLVRKNDTDSLYAMKMLRKSDVIELNQAAHVKAERDILAEANSEWIVKLYCSFQNDGYLFFIMEYIPGGDLMSLLIRKEIFDEDSARFYTAELVCAINSVHTLGFIHRDIKPDNVLIDHTGHIKLTDFGLCTGLRWTHDKKYYQQASRVNGSAHVRDDSFDLLRQSNATTMNHNSSSLPIIGGTEPKLLKYRQMRKRMNAHSLVGTSNYMAPEVLLSGGHNQLCDWWSVGVILYEMVVGCPPFYANDTRESVAKSQTQHKVVNWRQYLHIPTDRGLSIEVRDLILQLCCDAQDRIGANGGAAEIKQHPWFTDIDFDQIRSTRAPYVPHILHPTDTSNFDAVQTQSDEDSCDETQSSANKSSRKANNRYSSKSQQKTGSMPFYEFTFRHFFDMEPMDVGKNNHHHHHPMPKQRPSLAPLLEASQNASDEQRSNSYTSSYQFQRDNNSMHTSNSFNNNIINNNNQIRAPPPYNIVTQTTHDYLMNNGTFVNNNNNNTNNNFNNYTQRHFNDFV